MNLSARLARLSARATTVAPAADAGPRTDENWLAAFERHAAEGTAAAEPDFPRAVAEYRTAVAAAQAAGTLPATPGSSHGPVLDEWDWPAAILIRAMSGVPPVSEAEFSELAAWFDANEGRLSAASVGQTLDLGDGVRESIAALRYGVRQGVRATDAGHVADKLRRARARYG